MSVSLAKPLCNQVSCNLDSNPARTHHAAWLQPQGYLHLQEGPIDLVIAVEGTHASVERAYQQMNQAFSGTLHALVRELKLLRQPVRTTSIDTAESPFTGAVANIMWYGCKRFESALNGTFDSLLNPLTPMAGVAGAVADSVLAVGMMVPGVEKIWVNNGGDIALHLRGTATFDCGIVGMQNLPADTFSGHDFGVSEDGSGSIRLGVGDGVGGVATSGRHGRSLSLGIADSVTVLAQDAVTADIAATLIANSVDLPRHTGIQRVMAKELDPDSDLGAVKVVTEVGELNSAECLQALDGGLAIARHLQQTGLINAALLTLDDQSRLIGAAGRYNRLT